MTEQEARDYVETDQELFEREWDSMTEALTEIMKKKNPNNTSWKARMENFGWLNENGSKYFQAKTGVDLLHEILPDTECTFKIFNDGRGLKIQNFHHDSPVGNEWYFIRPISDGTYERNA